MNSRKNHKRHDALPYMYDVDLDLPVGQDSNII